MALLRRAERRTELQGYFRVSWWSHWVVPYVGRGEGVHTDSEYHLALVALGVEDVQVQCGQGDIWVWSSEEGFGLGGWIRKYLASVWIILYVNLTEIRDGKTIFLGVPVRCFQKRSVFESIE